MNKETALDLLLILLMQAEKISSLIRAMRLEGRDELTKEEIAVLRAEDDAARARLKAAIDSAE